MSVHTLFGKPLFALISPDQKYRYFLQRPIGDGKPGRVCTFIMLNPSTADAYADDPTIRRCKTFAARLKCDWLHVVNLFAYRTTDPDTLYRLSRAEAIGPENDNYIVAGALASAHIICGWGNHGRLHGRAEEVLRMLKQLRSAPTPHALKINQNGQPAHPLYLRGDSQLCPL